MRYALPVALAVLGWAACSPPEPPRTPAEELRLALEQLDAGGPEKRFYRLGEVARWSFEVGEHAEASRHATELLELAEDFPDDWNHGNAIHDGHAVLGRIALAEGRTPDARRHLKEAGRTPGSPQLDTFGPNVSLARDLLEAGESECVLEYFELCARFWRLGQDDLRRWRAAVEAGEKPDFGANLVH